MARCVGQDEEMLNIPWSSEKSRGVGGAGGGSKGSQLQAVLLLAYFWALSLFHPRKGTEAQLRDVY